MRLLEKINLPEDVQDKSNNFALEAKENSNRIGGELIYPNYLTCNLDDAYQSSQPIIVEGRAFTLDLYP